MTWGEKLDTIIEVAAIKYPSAQILKSMQTLKSFWNVDISIPANGADRSIVPL